MEFKIRDDIEIRSLSFRTKKMTAYTAEDTARYVSYFLDKINSITDLSKPIGVRFGGLSFISTCCLLALIKSGRHYGIIYYQNNDLREDKEHLFSHVFNLGPFWNTDKNKIESVLEYETEGSTQEINSDLTFVFQPTQKVYALIDNSDQFEVLTTTGKFEESSIKAAMDYYFSEDDYCVFSRPIQHIGVATLCIYPALFKAKGISFCYGRTEWAIEINRATHVHFGYHMISEKWPLPKKLRMLTTGGYDFNHDCIKYVKSQCEIENIVDCYGTKNCPPPLAIRNLEISNHPIPFKWVNDFIKFDIREYMLHLTSIEPKLFVLKDSSVVDYLRTMDTAFATDETTLYLRVIPNPAETVSTVKSNNIIGNIRMHHLTYADCDFVQFIKDTTDLSLKLAYHFDHGIFYPKILVNANELDQCVKFVEDNNIEATIYIKYDPPPQ